jgi:hypothetical protein
VHTNVRDFNISRIDRQGNKEPQRWTAVQKGQPVSLENAYTNWIKAAPESLFNLDRSIKQKFISQLPGYPDFVYDYHYVDRVISVGVNLPDRKDWNGDLAKMLSKAGPQKQVNVVILFVKGTDKQYMRALEEHWLGGKKNDVIVVFSTPNYPSIEWVEVLSWTDNKLFHVQLRDTLQSLAAVDRGIVLSSIDLVIREYYIRKRMGDFEYLKDSIEPPMWVIVLSLLLGVGSSLGMTYYFHKNDVRFF